MKPEKTRKKEKPQLQSAKSKEGSFSVMTIVLNAVGGIAVFIFINVLIQNVPGDNWLLDTMLKDSLKQIENNPPNATVEQRYELKWGGAIGAGEVSFINKVKQQTPDTAVILLPPRQLFTNVGLKSFAEVAWTNYFLYPRKVVYEDDKDSSALYPKVNYILAVNGWGMDKVNYKINRPEAFMVLPLKK